MVEKFLWLKRCLLEKENRKVGILVEIDIYLSQVSLLLYTLIVKIFVILLLNLRCEEVKIIQKYKDVGIRR